MTDIRDDERVIAEWLGYKWVVPKNKYYDPQWEGAKGECVRVEFSVNANLWPGIIAKVCKQKALYGAFDAALREEVPIHPAIGDHHRAWTVAVGPEAWTRALAQAIRQMQGG